jgi:hypothetical protein
MLAVEAGELQATTMAINPESQATDFTSELPEPRELPSHIQNRLESDTRGRAPSRPSGVDRSAETVRPPTASPKRAAFEQPASSDDAEVPPVPAAPRVPVI